MAAPSPIGFVGTFVRFAVPTAALLLVFELVIPALSQTGLRMPLPWFAGGAVVFAGMAAAAVFTVRAEGVRWSWSSVASRLRLRPMDRADWLWSLGAVAAIGALIGLTMGIASMLTSTLGLPGIAPTPAALAFEPLKSGERWILLVWLPFWVLNIVGEELWWRGIILPRQALAFGGRTWWVHALGWLAFHLAFGIQMLLFVAPIVFVQSWVCVRRRSTTVGVVIHGLVNGPGFVAVALGWL